MKPVILDIKGIQCDNKACDYQDLEAEFEPDKYLNAPCPKCGSNLFTQLDYDAMAKHKQLVELLNQAFSFVQIDENTPYLTTEIKMNGTGKAEIGEFRVKE